MKTVVVVRHAKSSWTDINLSDFERELNERGHYEAPVMAQNLMEFGVSPSIIISSPAVRAKSTANYFNDQFKVAIRYDQNLYHGEPYNYLEAINQLNEEIGSVILFGHNPGVTEIGNLVSPGCTINLPTCGILVFEVSEQTAWENMDWKDMQLVTLLTPKGSPID